MCKYKNYLDTTFIQWFRTEDEYLDPLEMSPLYIDLYWDAIERHTPQDSEVPDEY